MPTIRDHIPPIKGIRRVLVWDFIFRSSHYTRLTATTLHICTGPGVFMHVTFPYQFCVSKLRPATLFGPSEIAMAKVLGVLCLIPVLAEKACQGETCEDSSLMQLDRCSDQWRCHVICSVNMCAGFVCRSFFRHCGMSAASKNA